MNLNGPGTSLFQENDLSNFDNLEQREEEEEALEEQRRRDLELKNELENAFDDVSFDNDEESVYNGSGNHSSSAQSTTHSKSYQEVEAHFFNEAAQNRQNESNKSPNYHTENFSSPLKQTLRSNPGRRVDYNNDHENFSDEGRKKVQNGSLHDIVDQSGGGDQPTQTVLHFNNCFQRSPLGENICNGLSNGSKKILKPNYTNEAEDSTEQLKILYDVRVREVHRLTELIDSMRNEHEIELKDLKHQLALLMAEKERASISHSQLQSLLVDCKQQVEHLVNDVNALEKAKMELETKNRELMMEFDTAKLTVDDLQRKIIVLEKGNRSKSEAEQYELNLKLLTEKHNVELMNMKKELDNYIRNYESLFKENEDLKLKVINLDQINDENLAKKSEIISRLSQQIEDTQRQCENLMKLSTTEDNYRLQAELKILRDEKVQLHSKMENLEKEKTKLEEELKQFDYLNRTFFLKSNNSSNNPDLKDFDSSEVNGKLGAELFRALNNQKAKRLEIKNLQAKLDEKNEQISLLVESKKSLSKEVDYLKEEVTKYLSKQKENENLISQKEEENTKLQNCLVELQGKLKIYEDDFQVKCDQLEKENKILKDQVTALEKENTETMTNYSEEYLRFHNEGLEKMREETEKYFKLEILKKDLEIDNLKKEIDEIKKLYIEMCSAKENSPAERERGGSVRSSAVDLEEVKKLQKELEKSRHRILELDQTLKQQYEQEVEILNLDINQLKLQIEKLKKEKDRELADRDKISVENELLKMEIEQVTSDKNLLFLNHEKLLKETEELRESLEKMKENSKSELKRVLEMHSAELQALSNKYEITIKKLKKEVELTVAKAVKCESKYTSPIKNSLMKNVATQRGSAVLIDKSTSPIANPPENKPTLVANKVSTGLLRDISVLTDPEPVKISKSEVVDIMKKLGAHHEQEIMALEKKYAAELMKLEKKFHQEVDKAKEVIQRELRKEHQLELEQLEEKHKMEIENRIEQEKKEAVVDLITEWACEVQSLKVSYAESQAEMEKMKLKYKAAKNIALQYKTYFKSKAEHMKEEWKRIEDGYERALKELEKNVHILVDVKEDEVKAKVESITKLYEQKINKMKEKLSKCEGRLKGEKESGGSKRGESSKSLGKLDFHKDLERLSVPDGILYQKISLSDKKKRGEETVSQGKGPLYVRVEEDVGGEGEEGEEGEGRSGRKKKQKSEAVGGRERSKR